jgi:hypothetical protein
VCTSYRLNYLTKESPETNLALELAQDVADQEATSANAKMASLCVHTLKQQTQVYSYINFETHSYSEIKSVVRESEPRGEL